MRKKVKCIANFCQKINSSREKRNPFEPFFLAVRGATPLFKKSKHIKSPGDNLQAAKICANRQLYRHAECRRFLQLRIRGRSIVYCTLCPMCSTVIKVRCLLKFVKETVQRDVLTNHSFNPISLGSGSLVKLIFKCDWWRYSTTFTNVSSD